MSPFPIRKIGIILLLNVFLGVSFVAGKGKSKSMNPPTTVSSVDLNKYIGTWYEIAKIPNRFQKQCIRNTTATYRLRDDGKIDVINACETEDGTIDSATGIARVVDPKSNAKLEVSFVKLFGISLFWGDYWIIGLDPGYQYAVVGSPSRKYGWILSRTRKLSENQMQEIQKILQKNGYNFSDFEMTEQTDR